MPFRILFLLCFFVSAKLFPQGFTGTVLDAKKQKAVSGCIVILKGYTLSAITDDHGKFEFPLSFSTKDPVLVFTMLGYNAVEYRLSAYRKDTFFISPKNIQLKEIEIVADKKAILNPRSEEKILDFDILNDHILLLVPGKETNSLKLMNDHGDLVCRMKVSSHTEQLRPDCIGNLQLCGSDSTWQIFYDFEKLNSLNPFSRNSYERIMGNCVCRDNEYFYFQNMEYRNLRTSYFYFSEKEKGIRHHLVSYGDTAKIRSFELDYNLQYFLDVRRKSNYTMYNEPVDSIRLKMQRYREELPLDWSYTAWLGKVETQMVRTDSGIFIVNFTDSLIYSVNGNNTLNMQSKFAAAGSKDLLHQVFRDDDLDENYLIQFRNNTLILSRFDIRTGKELSRNEIPDVPYLPGKIRIHSGRVYFIQKNLADQQSYKLIKYYLKA